MPLALEISRLIKPKLAGESRVGFATDDLLDFGCCPQVELAFNAFAVGILGAEKTTVDRRHVP